MRHNNPPRAITTGMVKNQMSLGHGTQAASESFLTVEGRNIILSAVKRAEQSEALIVRLYNPSDTPSQATILLPFVATKVDLVELDEQPRQVFTAEREPVFEDDKTVKVALAAKKIITLRIERA